MRSNPTGTACYRAALLLRRLFLFFSCDSGISVYMRILFSRGIRSARRLLHPSSQGAPPASFLPAPMAADADASANLYHRCCGRYDPGRLSENVVVIMGATGTGKSKLSIDIATRFAGEVVNSDKIQVYSGLDITTNKIPIPDRRGIPHHLLGDLDPAAGELPPSGFRSLAASAIAGIAARGRLPVLAGGSNSFIHALLTDRHDPGSDPFRTAGQDRLRYRCCFLWVDVDGEVLGDHLDKRVDEMIGEGMVDELEEYFAVGHQEHPGLGKAIGVPEFREYFSGEKRAEKYDAAVRGIKENTRQLAATQVWKIGRLTERGWALRRVDATAVVRTRMAGAGKTVEAEAWERDVVGPSVEAVRLFLSDDERRRQQQPRLLLPQHQPLSSVS